MWSGFRISCGQIRVFRTVGSRCVITCHGEREGIDGKVNENRGNNGTQQGNEAVTVYVHWPFCKQLCTFCNFNKYVRDNVNHARMRRCLVKELKTLLELSAATKVISVYFGGGTPSLAEPATISAVLDCVSSMCHLDQGAEVSLEANPSSSERLLFRSFKAAGVNRLSLGVQSLCSRDLVLLGRDHTVEDALRSMEEANELFGGRVSIDMLFGRPNQAINAWAKELNKVLKHCDNHVSLYQLTLEKGTALYRSVKMGHVSLPDVDTMADLYQLSVQTLEESGLLRYEVANFAMPGSESEHNLSYWTGVPYIGVGPGAHGRFSVTLDGKRTRFARVQTLEPNAWMEEVEQFGHATRQAAPQSTGELLEEIFISGLRTKQGVSNQRWLYFAPEEFSNLSVLFGSCADTNDFISAGLLEVDARGIRATSNGLSVVDSLATPLALHLEQCMGGHT